MLTDIRMVIASANIQEWTSHHYFPSAANNKAKNPMRDLRESATWFIRRKPSTRMSGKDFFLLDTTKNIYGRNLCEWNNLEQPNSESMQISFLAIDPFIQDSRSVSCSANILSAIFFFLRSSRSRQFFLTNLITAIYFESAIARNRSWKIFQFSRIFVCDFCLFFISRSGSNEIF